MLGSQEAMKLGGYKAWRLKNWGLEPLKGIK
jgi:hypothetical protein